MSIALNLYYTGTDGNAKLFVKQMMESGIVEEVRMAPGNLRYEYFFPADDPETVLLIDTWEDQAALDAHHASPVMDKIAELRNEYELTMRAERFVSDDESISEHDRSFLRE